MTPEHCIELLSSDRPALADAALAEVRTRLRAADVADTHAEQFALRVSLAHLEALDVSAPAELWRGGFGERGFGLLVDYLASSALVSETLEWAITDLREALLRGDFSSAPPPDQARLLDLAAALALQAFRSEYVFPEGRGEAAAVARLESRLEEPLAFALYAAYRPLHALPRAVRAAPQLGAPVGSVLALLIRTQITEPLVEAALRPAIRSLTPIAEGASQAVRQQYEENPYPRWHRLRVHPAEEPAAAPRERHLIAGCGTGQHPVSAALLTPQADILAVDLSLASLAYAKRKAAEHQVRNLEFAQADLLRLAQAGLKPFDAISCVGVLHHLERPLEGLRVLRALMARPHGLKVAVYTESGRAGIVAAIRLREEYKLPATADGIREFRQMIYSLPARHPARQLIGSLDFFSISGCRDMAFHVVEHRYTLPAFAELAARAGLRIERVLAPPALLQRFAVDHPGADPAADLAAWARFEAAHPGCFGSMYRFMLAHSQSPAGMGRPA